jgi:hypothetical protein
LFWRLFVLLIDRSWAQLSRLNGVAIGRGISDRITDGIM